MMSADKNVPLTKIYGKYPFRTMEVGDSFDFAPYTNSNANKAGSYCYRRGKTLSRTFVYRQHVENSERRIRIWRTA
jgi:hypothetical protein